MSRRFLKGDDDDAGGMLAVFFVGGICLAAFVVVLYKAIQYFMRTDLREEPGISSGPRDNNGGTTNKFCVNCRTVFCAPCCGCIDYCSQCFCQGLMGVGDKNQNIRAESSSSRVNSRGGRRSTRADYN